MSNVGVAVVGAVVAVAGGGDVERHCLMMKWVNGLNSDLVDCDADDDCHLIADEN